MTSFPKAKIHRFNEPTTCAPPPGTYDPKQESKVKGAVLSSCKRFPDQLCVSSSLDSLDKANPPQITFRTPQAVKKKIPLTPRLKYLQEKKFDTPGSDSSNSSTEKPVFLKPKKEISQTDYQRLERELSALADQHMNELLEKDLEITLLHNEIQEIQKHEAELKDLLEEKTILMAERVKEHLELKENLDTMIDKLSKERESHTLHIEGLENQISALQAKKYELEEIIAEKKDAIVIINDKYADLENKLKDLLEEKEYYQLELVSVEKTNSEILDRLFTETTEEIDRLDEKLKAKFEIAEKQFDSAIQTLHIDFQSKFNLESHEIREKTREMAKELEKYSETIKELRKIIKEKGSNFANEIAEADERCKLLFRELCKVEQERDELVQSDLERKLVLVDCQKKCNVLEEDLFQYRAKCKKYEVTLNSMQDTLQALSQRLLESDKEVERLSKVEVDLEDEKKILEEKSQSLLDDISALRGGMDQLEKDIISDVTGLKEHLMLQLEQFKTEAAKKVEVLNKKISEKQLAIDLLLRENDYFRTELERKDDIVNDLQSRLNQFKEEIKKLNHKYYNSEEEFSERLCAEKNLQKILSEKLENANNINGELQSTLDYLNENLQRCKIETTNYEQEIKSLRNINSAQNLEITNIQTEIQRIQDKSKDNESALQQHIDDLISDLVLEKERYVALESEKSQIKFRLISAEESYNKKSTELRDLTAVNRMLQTKVNDLEKNKIVFEEANSMLENKLIVLGENHAMREVELKETISKMEKENEELQSDNVQKAQYILELSMQFDSVKEPLLLSEERIVCLEAEKESLNLQLDEMNLEIRSLKDSLNKKDNIINDLKKQLVMEEQNSKHNLLTIEELHKSVNIANEQQKIYLETDIQLSIAEEKIQDLERTLSEQGKNSHGWEQEVQCLKEELEIITLNLKKVTEERDKANKELADLMGHQNLQQKIKHVSSLKLAHSELTEKCDRLEVENMRLRKKLAEYQGKENAVPRSEITPNKIKSKLSKKLTLSPGVLKERNQL